MRRHFGSRVNASTSGKLTLDKLWNISCEFLRPSRWWRPALLTRVFRDFFCSWVAKKSFEISTLKFKFPRARTYELIRARSRLYRSHISRVNTRWKALAEIYTMHSFAPFSHLNFFVKNCWTLNFLLICTTFSKFNLSKFVRLFAKSKVIFDQFFSGYSQNAGFLLFSWKLLHFGN